MNNEILNAIFTIIEESENTLSSTDYKNILDEVEAFIFLKLTALEEERKMQ